MIRLQYHVREHQLHLEDLVDQEIREHQQIQMDQWDHIDHLDLDHRGGQVYRLDQRDLVVLDDLVDHEHQVDRVGLEDPFLRVLDDMEQQSEQQHHLEDLFDLVDRSYPVRQLDLERLEGHEHRYHHEGQHDQRGLVDHRSQHQD